MNANIAADDASAAAAQRLSSLSTREIAEDFAQRLRTAPPGTHLTMSPDITTGVRTHSEILEALNAVDPSEAKHNPEMVRERSDAAIREYNENQRRIARGEPGFVSRIEKNGKGEVIPVRGGGGGGGPGDPYRGGAYTVAEGIKRVIITIGNYRKVVAVAVAIAIGIALGYLETQIIDMIKQVQNGNTVQIEKPNDDRKPSDTENLHDYIFSDGSTTLSDRTYVVIKPDGTIEPPKLIVQKSIQDIFIPSFDRTSGADTIELTPDIKINSVLSKQTTEYNRLAREYNDILDEKGSGPEYEKRLVNQEARMKDVTEDIRRSQKNSLLNEVKYEPIVSKRTLYATTSSGEIYTYDYIPTSDYTDSIGISDDIREYNKQAEEFNTRVKNGERSGIALHPQIQNLNVLGAKIEGASRNPEKNIAKPAPILIPKEYPSDVKELISSVIDPSMHGRGYLDKLDYGSSNLASYPREERLFKEFNEKIDEYNNSTGAKQNAAAYRLKAIQKELEGLSNEKVESSAISRDPYKNLQNENAFKINTERGEASPIDQNAMNAYTKSKRDYELAAKKFKNAVDSGADSATINALHNDVTIKRAGFRRNEQEYSAEINRYNRDTRTRGTYLSSFDQEKLPQTNEEKKEFMRLQNLESVVQGNHDALFAYNDAVSRMDRNQSPIEYYRNRQTLIKMIAEQNNLQSEYKEAYNQPIDISYDSEAGQDQIIQEGEYTGENTDTIVRVPHKDTAADPAEEHAHERAESVDPAEIFLFKSTGAQANLSEQAFNDFAIVQKNHGLGSTNERDRNNYNPLVVREKRQYLQQYGLANKPLPLTNVDKADYNNVLLSNKYEQVGKTISMKDLKVQPNAQNPLWVDTRFSNFGTPYFEDVQYNVSKNGKIPLFTDEKVKDNNWDTWENRNSIFHPDFQLFGKSEHPRSVILGDVNKPAPYRYIPDRFDHQEITNGASCIKARIAGVPQDEMTRRNDNLFSQPHKRSIYDGLSPYQ